MVAGLPLWELAALGGPVPAFRWSVLPFLVFFGAGFLFIQNSNALLLWTSAVLGVALLRFHTPLDFAYVAYAMVVGAAVEYVGVNRLLWSYPAPPAGGVPFWFLTMWGGLGLFTRRVFLPAAALLAPPIAARNDDFSSVR